MNIPIPLPVIETPPLERAVHRFESAVWYLIIAYSDAVDVDEMRGVLEDTLMSYYDVNGDGTIGSA